MKKERVKSGVEGFDEMLDGGFPKASITTLSGPTGAGKSTFAMQFLVKGATKYMEPGLYISIEESKAAVYNAMSDYKWDFEKLEMNKQLIFLDYPPYEVDQFLAQNSAIGNIIETTGVERVVIDSIMPIALAFQNDIERKKGFLRLMDNIRRWGATTIIVSEDTAASSTDTMPATNYGVESFTDGWVHLYYSMRKNGVRKRNIEIIKMKGTKHSMKVANCRITDDGFVVEMEK